MDRVETRGRVPLETLLDRLAWRNAAAAACAACAGLLAGLMAAAGLRGCAPHAGMQAGLDAARTRAALERNIREGIYPDVPCGEEEREDRSRFSYTKGQTTRREPRCLSRFVGQRSVALSGPKQRDETTGAEERSCTDL